MKSIFDSRQHAGRELAKSLLGYQYKETVVLAIPRGGVAIGYEIALALRSPLEALVIRKLGSPHNPELGIGAIGSENIRILNRKLIGQLKVDPADISAVESSERWELTRRNLIYGVRPNVSIIRAKTVIVADDGLATGLTMKAAILVLRKFHPKKLIVAVPVCSQEAYESVRSSLKVNSDELVCLIRSDDFTSIGSWYKQFNQVTDREVVSLLSQAKKYG